MTKRMLPPMPKGGYDIADVDPVLQDQPVAKKRRGKEFVDADGGDWDLHAAILGDDDQFVTEIPAIDP